MKKYIDFINEDITVPNVKQVTYNNKKCFVDINRIKQSTKQIPAYLDEELTIPFIHKHKLIPKGVHVYVPVYNGKIYNEKNENN